ncbi:hypothetical protein ANO11243_047860 [Dothideomycetidae sp. 11243]|nr:hypothetical protein ANO11243_047860 [fungal sp. No.11243]
MSYSAVSAWYGAGFALRAKARTTPQVILVLNVGRRIRMRSSVTGVTYQIVNIYHENEPDIAAVFAADRRKARPKASSWHRFLAAFDVLTSSTLKQPLDTKNLLSQSPFPRRQRRRNARTHTAIMATPLARIQTLIQTQCRIFNTIYNPQRLRLGNKILRQRLKGPSLAAYYPRRIATIKDVAKAYPDYEIIDEDEDDRLENVQITKSRGKGPPKKKRTKEVKGKGKKK